MITSLQHEHTPTQTTKTVQTSDAGAGAAPSKHSLQAQGLHSMHTT